MTRCRRPTRSGAADAGSALRTLLGTVLGAVAAGPDGRDPAARGHSVELALRADDRHPAVAAALDRVGRRRLEYLTVLFTGLGFGPDDARRRALLAFTAYLGHVQLARATPELVPRAADPDACLDGMLAALTSATSSP